MKRALLLVACLSLPVGAAEGWEAACEREGGCMLITQRAFERLVAEIERLQRTLVAVRKEQCA